MVLVAVVVAAAKTALVVFMLVAMVVAVLPLSATNTDNQPKVRQLRLG